MLSSFFPSWFIYWYLEDAHSVFHTNMQHNDMWNNTASCLAATTDFITLIS